MLDVKNLREPGDEAMAGLGFLQPSIFKSCSYMMIIYVDHTERERDRQTDRATEKTLATHHCSMVHFKFNTNEFEHFHRLPAKHVSLISTHTLDV